MPIRFIATLTAGLGLAGAASAEVPKVATDITPVHSLVARVMQGVGEPSLIVAPGATPHGYSMRPSEAAALEAADIVIWIGPDLTPWLEGAIGTLAADAHSLALLDAPGTRTLSFRQGATFDAHDHGEDHDEDTMAMTTATTMPTTAKITRMTTTMIHDARAKTTTRDAQATTTPTPMTASIRTPGSIRRMPAHGWR
ncbi:MAG: zinc ABC transporter substrate-binding protein [Roseovarius sp.]|nr:zinc ABC transporter substrate-binding protein [Roseovarius sp.]